MITKVSYRPYTLDVSSKQNQPQKVNFGMNFDSVIKLTEQEFHAGTRLSCHLLSLYSAGRARRPQEVPIIIGNTLQLLSKTGGGKLASAAVAALKRRGMQKVIAEADRISTVLLPADPLVRQTGSQFMACLRTLSGQAHPNSKTNAMLGILEVCRQHPDMTLEELGSVIAQRLGVRP